MTTFAGIRKIIDDVCNNDMIYDMIYFIGNISILQLLATTIIQSKHDIHALHIIQYIHNILLSKYIVPMNLHKLFIICRNWH